MAAKTTRGPGIGIVFRVPDDERIVSYVPEFLVEFEPPQSRQPWPSEVWCLWGDFGYMSSGLGGHLADGGIKHTARGFFRPASGDEVLEWRRARQLNEQFRTEELRTAKLDADALRDMANQYFQGDDANPGSGNERTVQRLRRVANLLEKMAYHPELSEKFLLQQPAK